MSEYLDKTGLTYLLTKLKARFAPLDSPVMTGTPAAPTAPAGTNSTQVATTAYVDSKCFTWGDLKNGAGGVE